MKIIDKTRFDFFLQCLCLLCVVYIYNAEVKHLSGKKEIIKPFLSNKDILKKSHYTCTGDV